MLFRSEVKDELAKHISTARHCQIAELTALLYMNGHLKFNNDLGRNLVLYTENTLIIKKCIYLIKKLFSYEAQMFQKSPTVFYMEIDNHITEKILMTTKLYSGLKNIVTDSQEVVGQQLVLDSIVIQNACCKRAFLRGAFLVAGSVNNPEKAYHFEIVCLSEEVAVNIQKVCFDFDLDAKIIIRKKYFVVYIKEGEMIVDALNIMEAHGSLMNMENVRIVKSVRNSINRRVNCETANINKTVNAAVKQLEDIEFIDKEIGLSKLAPQLRSLALKRIEEPDASLKELGEMLSPPVSKSGVNHRLRKICEIANELREGKSF